MRTRMKKNSRPLRGTLDIPLHALKVQPDRILVEILVLLDLQSRVFGNRNMVAPCGCGEVDGLGAGVKAGQEGGADPQGAGAGDTLGDGESVFFERGGIFAVGELGGELGEVCQALWVGQLLHLLGSGFPLRCAGGLPASRSMQRTVIGRYSLSPLASYSCFSALATEGKTYGLPLSSRWR